MSTQAESMEFVDYHEPLSIKVGNLLLSKGYRLASCIGNEEDILRASECVGILGAKRPRRFGLFRQRSVFYGTIWFQNERLHASEESWVFEIYGHDHAESMRRLANEMAKIFKVKITVRLVSEQPDVETLMSDFDC